MTTKATIGVLIGNANSPYNMELMRGIRKAAENQQVNVVFYVAIHSNYAYRVYFGADAIDDYDYQNNIVYDYTQISKVDALIIAYGSLGIFMENNDRKAFLEKFADIPYVLVGDRDETMRGTSIIADNYFGMYELAEHLIRDHGYKKVTYLSGPKGNQDAAERLLAVKDVMERYEIEFDESCIEYGDFSQCVTPQIGKLFLRHPDMEAMICANDLMADAVYDYCKKHNRTVGTDIAVTGYDDWENAEFMNPPLTTVSQNAYEIGYLTIKYALALLKGRSPETVVIPGQVKYRASSYLVGHDRSKSRRNDKVSEEELKQRFAENVRSNKHQRDIFAGFQQESWFIPLISRDMMNSMEDEKAFYYNALRRLPSLRIKRSWLFLFEQPVVHKYSEPWNVPESIYLMAVQDTREVTSYDKSSAPVLNAKNHLQKFLQNEENYESIVLCLYSGETHYGFLVLETDVDNLSISYLISMQIANGLNFYELTIDQRSTRKELEGLVKEVKEKNEVLNFISEYDALTGCLNRRGFMERVVRLNHEKTEGYAILIFADLDHLKEINDTFGHFEGDFAIQYCAKTLQRIIAKSGFVGRIGGDEFAAMITVDDKEIVGDVIRKLKEANDEFNRTSDKPYYIEFSVGSVVAKCNESLELSQIMKEADQALYVSKKQRRVSVQKYK